MEETNKINIRSGSLQITSFQEDQPITSLLGFASRENPKRGFLFVSKILGKHIPVKPSVMRSSYDTLADKINDSHIPTIVIGMAETAVGLGAGVADSLSRKFNTPVYYTHTTRHNTGSPIAFTLDESHSHATDHIVYEPRGFLSKEIKACRRIVLVDDEISTGRTLKLLAERCIQYFENVEEIIFVSLVNWISNENKSHYKEINCKKLRFEQLYRGEFDFTQDPEFLPSLPLRSATGLDNNPGRKETGRKGIKMPYDFNRTLPVLDHNKKYSVIGSSEHLFTPFLMAEKLENDGHDIVFQSTTRSPILSGDAIKEKITFSNENKNEDYYIYNFDEKRIPIVVCEDKYVAKQDGLSKKLNTIGIVA